MRKIGSTRVHVTGRDGIGWSIDHDRSAAVRHLTEAGMKVVRSSLTANVIHSVWWRTLFGKKGRAIRTYARLTRQRIVATVTNEVFLDDPQYKAAKGFVDIWVAGNYKQLNRLKQDGVEIHWQPFYVDEKVFGSKGRTKQELCVELGIDFQVIRDRFLIGNFQRDTAGADLSSPKEQKDPAKLIRILSNLPDKEKWLLLLTGPRRHYVIAECNRQNIPYAYVGTEPKTNEDDIHINVQSEERMALLNELADCSLTTSKWEGGPKAILEGAYGLSYVLTTPVGNAPDILPPENLFSSEEEAISKLTRLLDSHGSEQLTQQIETVRDQVLNICGNDATLKRWQEIYRSL